MNPPTAIRGATHYCPPDAHSFLARHQMTALPGRHARGVPSCLAVDTCKSCGEESYYVWSKQKTPQWLYLDTLLAKTFRRGRWHGLVIAAGALVVVVAVLMGLDMLLSPPIDALDHSDPESDDMSLLDAPQFRAAKRAFKASALPANDHMLTDYTTDGQCTADSPRVHLQWFSRALTQRLVGEEDSSAHVTATDLQEAQRQIALVHAFVHAYPLHVAVSPNATARLTCTYHLKPVFDNHPRADASIEARALLPYCLLEIHRGMLPLTLIPLMGHYTVEPLSKETPRRFVHEARRVPCSGSIQTYLRFTQVRIIALNPNIQWILSSQEAYLVQLMQDELRLLYFSQ